MTNGTRMPTVTSALEVRVVTGAGGGPEKTILNTPRFLRQHGFETRCAYMHPPNDSGFETIRRRADEWDAPLVSIPDRGIQDFRVVFNLARLCRRHRVKIWHGHDYKSNLLGLLIRPFHRMKLVTTVHGWVNQEGNMPLYSKIDRWCLKRYEHVICVSSDLFEDCEGLGINPCKLTLLENGIDESQYRRGVNLEVAKADQGVPANRLLIGAVGRLAEEKGFHLLLSAIARLLADGHEISLAIAGEGSVKQELEDQINALGIGNHVNLLGFVENTKKLFQAMDIFCLSSLREGLPNVLLEAMACEVPSVATDLPGVRQVINDPGKQAILVPPNSSDDLYVALKQLVVSQNQRRQMAAAGRNRIVERFSFEKRMVHVADIYRRVLSGTQIAQ